MIGISYHSGGLVDKPLPWVIAHLADVGYDAIEIVCGPEAHIRIGEPLEPQIDEARSLLNRYGLAVAAINPYTQPALAEYARDDLGGAVDRWCMLVDVAEALGAPVVNFLPGWLPEGDRAAWELVIEALSRICAYAEPKGVVLGIHNHEGMIIDSPDKCLNLIAHVGDRRLKVLCDITNFYILGADVGEAVHRLGPHVVHCHLKGVVGRYPHNRFLVPGEPDDEMPIAPFARALGEVGYERYISVETFSWMRDDKTRIAYDRLSAELRMLGLRD